MSRREQLALSAIEYRLRREDPEFASTMTALSNTLLPRRTRQSRQPAPPPPPPSRPWQRGWKVLLAVAAALSAVCALVLSATHRSPTCPNARRPAAVSTRSSSSARDVGELPQSQPGRQGVAASAGGC